MSKKMKYNLQGATITVLFALGLVICLISSVA